MKKAISAFICALTAALLCAYCTACGTAANNESSQNAAASSEASGKSHNLTDTAEQPEQISYESGSNNSGEKITAVPLSENEKAQKSISAFTNEMFKRCREDDKEKNTLVSPLSVYMALGMLNNGAKNTTQTEITNVLSGNFEGEADTNRSELSSEEINAAMKDCMVKSNDSGILNIANAFYVIEKDYITINDEFKKTVSDDYFAEIFYEKYSKQTVDKINSWVNDKTHKMIPSILPPDAVNQETVSVLVNAAAFEGKWLSPYDPEYDVTEREFTNYSGSIIKTDFMNSEENMYLSDENAVGFMKYYEPGENGLTYCFVGILPDKGVSIDDYVASLTGSTISDMVANKSSEDVIVDLPKFTFSNKYSLPNVLDSMGIHAACETCKADFTGLCSSNSVTVGDVIHKTFIDVDESGTRAAAATAIIMEDNMMEEAPPEPKRITLDRPFVFAIYDMNNNIPVFIGTVTDLTDV